MLNFFFFKFSQQHLKVQLGCRFCDKIFNDPSNRNRHEQTVHTKKGETSRKSLVRLKCSSCSATFGRRDNLNLHMKRVHGVQKGKLIMEEDKLLECGHCSTKFKAKLSLTKHLIDVHFPSLKHQTTSFKCHICNKEFRFSNSLKAHFDQFHVRKSHDLKSGSGSKG